MVVPEEQGTLGEWPGARRASVKATPGACPRLWSATAGFGTFSPLCLLALPHLLLPSSSPLCPSNQCSSFVKG